MKKTGIIICFLLCIGHLTAQNTEGVSISESVVPPHSSAMLDVSSESKGVLLPRVELLSLTTAGPIELAVGETKPPNGLIVYNKKTDGPVPSGYYYWQIDKWIPMRGGGGIPQVTYNMMDAMLPNVTLLDRGMLVYVTDPLGSFMRYRCLVEFPDGKCPGSYRVQGLWFLTSYLCGTTDILEWKKVGIETNFGDGAGACLISNCSCPVTD